MYRQQEPTNQHLPIFALTANNSSESIQECKKAGMDDFFTKPFQKEKILQKLDGLLSSPKIPSSIVTTTEIIKEKSAPVNLINMEKALDTFGDKNFLIEMYEDFYLNFLPRIKEIKNALDQQDAPTVARLAHNIKGISAGFGIENLRFIAAELEEQAKQCELANGQNLIQEIENLLPSMEDTLRIIKNKDEK